LNFEEEEKCISECADQLSRFNTYIYPFVWLHFYSQDRLDIHPHIYSTMDGMDMSGDGMTGLGSDVNHRFARAYWYITATVVGSLMVFRGINYVGAVKRYVHTYIRIHSI
jgi:hypothetical protein